MAATTPRIDDIEAKTDGVTSSGTGSSPLHIDLTNNRVGVGTTSPARLFTVAGKLQVNETDNGTAGASVFIRANGSDIPLLINNTSNSSNMFQIGETGGGGLLTLRDTSNVTQVQLSNNSNSYLAGGNLGVGTTNPQQLLEVSATNGPVLRFNSSDTAITSGEILGDIEFYTNDASTGGTDVQARIRSFAAGTFDGSPNNGGALTFATNTAGGSLTDRIILEATGGVRMGQSAGAGDAIVPTGTNLNMYDTSGDTASGVRRLLVRTANSTNGSYSGIGFSHHGGSSWASSSIVHQRDGSQGRGDMVFLVRNTTSSVDVAIGDEIMRINREGTITGDFVDTSDASLKENVAAHSHGLAIVDQLQPKSFDWIKRDYDEDMNEIVRSSIGFIAQDVEAILPDAVNSDGEFKAVKTLALVSVLTNAVKELKTKCDDYEARLAALEA